MAAPGGGAPEEYMTKTSCLEILVHRCPETAEEQLFAIVPNVCPYYGLKSVKINRKIEEIRSGRSQIIRFTQTVSA